MPRRAAILTQTDMARAFRAARQAGVHIRIDVSAGTIETIDADTDKVVPLPTEDEKPIFL
ncbi:MAG: hypothetical protein B7Y95_22525 [Rhizobiales bacterium 32-66-11]|nr:MAG: hypothetical protein B7Y95_22525 [Rhizobiales bacterium 32-66-11]